MSASSCSTLFRVNRSVQSGLDPFPSFSGKRAKLWSGAVPSSLEEITILGEAQNSAHSTSYEQSH